MTCGFGDSSKIQGNREMFALRAGYIGLLATAVLVSSGCAFNGGVQGSFVHLRDALRPIGATMNSKLYVVQMGDNLSYIAWRYQTTVENLIVWNNISDPDLLRAGQPIVVRGQPVSPVMTAAVKPVLRSASKPQVLASQAAGQLSATRLPASAADTVALQSVVIPPGSDQTIVVLQAPSVPVVTVKAKPAREEVVVSPVSYKKPSGGWVWPVSGRIMRPFGGPSSNQKGIDIGSVPGEPVRATSGGIVAFAGSDVSVLGHTVIIDHDGDFISAYTNVGELLVEEGIEVMAGDVIAYAAGVNGQQKSKVHFEIRKQGRPLDPLSRLAKR